MLLEAVNGTFLMLSLCAVAVFGHYIWVNLKEGYYVLRPAIALWFLFFGEVILRYNFWYARNLINNGFFVQPSTTMTVVGTLITAWAVLCTIAVFSPLRWGKRAWLLSLLATIAFVSLSLYL